MCCGLGAKLGYARQLGFGERGKREYGVHENGGCNGQSVSGPRLNGTELKLQQKDFCMQSPRISQILPPRLPLKLQEI